MFDTSHLTLTSKTGLRGTYFSLILMDQYASFAHLTNLKLTSLTNIITWCQFSVSLGIIEDERWEK